MREKILIPRFVQYIALPTALVIGFWFVNTIREVVIMFALAFIIALVMDQPVSLLQEKLRLPRVLAVVLVWLFILSVLGLVIAFLVPNIISELNYLIDRFPEYSLKVESISADVQQWFRDLELPYKPDITPADVASKLESAGVEIATRGLGFAQALFNIGLDVFLIFVISVYMLIYTERLKNGARDMVPQKFRNDAIKLFSRLQKALGSYLRGQLLVSTVMGVIGGIIAFYGGGGKYVFLIAIWVAATEVIPLIGPFIGAAPAVILAWFAVSPTRALVVFLLFLAAQQLEGHILVPRIMGKSVGVHPLWVMFAVLTGATLAGIMGGLVAVPLVAVIKVLIDFYREEMVLEQWQRPLLEKTEIIEEGEAP